MVFIYVLQLQQGKYYVGKTDNPQFRMERHFNSDGSKWTMKYRPIHLVELIPNCDDYDEDKYTRRYMDMYGIDNVRGGSFISVELEASKKEYLEKTTHKCGKCGNNGHFTEQCYQVQPDLWIRRESVDEYGNKRFHGELKPVTKEPNLLDFEEDAPSKSNTVFKNVNEPWTTEEDEQLNSLYNFYEHDVMGISRINNRTPGTIISRLLKHKYIGNRQSARGYTIYKNSDLYKSIVNEATTKSKETKKKKPVSPPDICTEVTQLRQEIVELKTTVKELVEMMKAVYEFEDA
jgi:predicted GIY-YIG superfamily endonuclease